MIIHIRPSPFLCLHFLQGQYKMNTFYVTVTCPQMFQSNRNIIMRNPHFKNLPFLTKCTLLHNIFIFIGRWHEFGRVHDKLLIGMLTGLGSVFIVYLFYTPRKVGKRNTIPFIPCTNHFYIK